MSSLADRLLAVPPWLALLLIFGIPAAEASIFVGLFFPRELIILLGGVLAKQDKLSLWSVIAVGSAGAIVGDSKRVLLLRRAKASRRRGPPCRHESSIGTAVPTRVAAD